MGGVTAASFTVAKFIAPGLGVTGIHAAQPLLNAPIIKVGGQWNQMRRKMSLAHGES